MLDSPTDLRWLPVCVMFFLVPFSAAAQGNVSCGSWTDDPIVSGSTPLRAEHINEIRGCLDRIIQILNITPPPPPPDETVTLTQAVVYRVCPDHSSFICLGATIVNNFAETIRIRTWTAVHDENDRELWVETRPSSEDYPRVRDDYWPIVAGGQRRVVALAFFRDGPNTGQVATAAYFTIRVTTDEGVPLPCSGCATRWPWYEQ